MHQRFLLMREADCCWPTQGKLWSRWRESNPRCGRTGTADFRYPTPAGVGASCPPSRRNRTAFVSWREGWRDRPESHRVWAGHGRPCRTVTLRPRSLVRPGGVAPPSGGYRPPVLRLNYERLERPAGFAPAVSSLAGKRLAPRPRPHEKQGRGRRGRTVISSFKGSRPAGWPRPLLVPGCGIEPPVHGGREFYGLAPIPLGSPGAPKRDGHVLAVSSRRGGPCGHRTRLDLLAGQVRPSASHGPRISKGCRPPVPPRVLLVFGRACDSYTRAANGCRGRSRTCNSDVQGVVSVPIQSARQWRCQGVPPPYLLLDRQACRSATPWHRAGRRGAAPRREALEASPVAGPQPVDRAAGIAPAPAPWEGAVLLSHPARENISGGGSSPGRVPHNGLPGRRDPPFAQSCVPAQLSRRGPYRPSPLLPAPPEASVGARGAQTKNPAPVSGRGVVNFPLTLGHGVFTPRPGLACPARLLRCM